MMGNKAVYGDAMLVIQQMFGHWRILGGIYAPFAHRAKALRQTFTNLYGHWIPRTQHTVADALSKAPLLCGTLLHKQMETA